MWFLILSAGAVIGYGVAACMRSAAGADSDQRRCRNCSHCIPLPEEAPDYFTGCFDCTFGRGENVELSDKPISLSLVSPDGFCNNFKEDTQWPED